MPSVDPAIPHRFKLPILLLIALLWWTPTQLVAAPVLNEVMSSNGVTVFDEDEDAPDWIELHNPTDTHLSLLGYGLSDDPSRPFRWTFPNVELSPGTHLLVWASGKDRADPDAPLHTNFRLSVAGESLLLTRPDGLLLDFVMPPVLPRDVSYGRQPDGTGDWFLFADPTPGQPNLSAAYTEVAAPPLFSQSGGFFTEPFSLLLSSPHPDATILYTLDGSLPETANRDGRTYHYKNQYPQHPGDPFGPLLDGSYQTLIYSQPLPILDRASEPDRLTGRSTTWHRSAHHYTPIEPVFKGTVVRARTVREGAIPSPVITHTYFVTPEGADRYSLPVLALTIQEDHLFDYEIGSYVAGIDFDLWKADWPTHTANAESPANYRRSGATSEHPLHIELFEAGLHGRTLAQDVGFRVHGAGSRSFPQKSIRLHAKRGYDSRDTLDYPFFPGLRDRIANSPITSFRRLVLRNSGQDHQQTRIRDAFVQKVLEPLGLDFQAYEPAIHFINGEFWGLINLRERIDRHYLASHYHLDPDDVALLTWNAAVEEGIEADSEDYLALRDHIELHDMADPEHWARVTDQMDVDNFLRYQIAQIFAQNTDWPRNNSRWWRKRSPDREPGRPVWHDGRWRWILFDLDIAYYGWDSSVNSLDHATAADSPHWSNPDWSTVVLRSLLANPHVRARFINAFADHLNTTFLPGRAFALVDTMHARIQQHLPEHQRRWPNMTSPDPWFLKTFAHQRPPWMRYHLVRFFHLTTENIGSELLWEDFETWRDGLPEAWESKFDANVGQETSDTFLGSSALRLSGAGLDIWDERSALIIKPRFFTDHRFASVRISGAIKKTSGTGFVRLFPRYGVYGSRVELEPKNSWQRFEEVVRLDWRAGIGDLTISASEGLEFLLDDLRIEEVHIPEGTATVTLDVNDPDQGHLQINTIKITRQTPGLLNPDHPYPWSGLYFQAVPITVSALPAPGHRFAGWIEYPDVTDPTLELLPTDNLQITARFEPLPASPAPFLIHYWSFNDQDRLTEPDYTAGNAHLSLRPSEESQLLAGSGQGFAGHNARLGLDAGTHLRLNNPLGSTLTFHLPTTGFEHIHLLYETRRSGQGPGMQVLSYTTNGFDPIDLATVTVLDADPVLQSFDLTGLPGVDDNPDFAIHITFLQDNGGTAGNHRYDNLSIEGLPTGGVNLPPIPYLGLTQFDLIQGVPPPPLDLGSLFLDPDEDPLEFLIQTDRPHIVQPLHDGHLLELLPLHPGEARIDISAHDGHHPPVSLVIRVVVHPQPHPLAESKFSFAEWAPNQVPGVYPPHMVFEQTATGDPDLAVPMTSFWTLPYNLTTRSRINGLAEFGLSFLNTGNAQDLPNAGFLGSAILALDTRDADEVWVAWTGGTVLPNDRAYGLRLQYRIGTPDDWTDVHDEAGDPVEYTRHPSAGHATRLGPVRLPTEASHQDYVQLRWRYHHVSGDSGPRAQLRLDDIVIATEPSGTLDPPSITRQPVSGIVLRGHTLTFSVEADGFDPRTYQWFLNDEPIPHATEPVLEVEHAQLADAGAYHAVVTDPGGSIDSQPAHLTVIGIQLHTDSLPAQPLMIIAGRVGNRYQIDSTDSLTQPVSWDPGIPFTLDDPVVEIVDDSATDASLRSYRVILLPIHDLSQPAAQP